MLDKTGLAVNPKVFTDKQVALIKRAASYPEVERIFVHPAIKKAAPDAKIITFGSDPECVQALKQGRGDAYVQDEAVLLATAKQDPTVKIQGRPFTSDPYGIGLKHGDAQMKQFVNDWLQKIEASGLWAKVWKNSIGTVVQGDAPQPPALGSAPGSQ